MKVCPNCGSQKIAPILYGMPAFDEETVRQIKEKKLYLGGCCISDNDPQFHCFKCKKGFYTPKKIEAENA